LATLSLALAIWPASSCAACLGKRPSCARVAGTGAGRTRSSAGRERLEGSVNGIIYLVGLIVVIMAILSFVGIH
jgi:hypothetical protein